jgi:hypothetical protein
LHLLSPTAAHIPQEKKERERGVAEKPPRSSPLFLLPSRRRLLVSSSPRPCSLPHSQVSTVPARSFSKLPEPYPSPHLLYSLASPSMSPFLFPCWCRLKIDSLIRRGSLISCRTSSLLKKKYFQFSRLIYAVLTIRISAHVLVINQYQAVVVAEPRLLSINTLVPPSNFMSGMAHASCRCDSVAFISTCIILCMCDVGSYLVQYALPSFLQKLCMHLR